MPDPAGRRGSAVWAVLAGAVAVLPILGAFTTSRIFYVRDLSLFFFSRHLWLRHTIFGGTFPLWDPHVAAGQPAAPDALNQLFMPVTLVVRLLPSDIVSFNLWVALPLPIAALGTYAFLRRTHGARAAAFGASAFGLSGPMASTLNAPNLSWSVAMLPWILWSASLAIESATPRRVVGASALVALQALAGEPVTLATTAVVAIVFAGCAEGDGGRRGTVRRMATVSAAIAGGVLLAAVQLVPTVLAGVKAHRGAMATPDFWSLHPLGLFETVVPHVFGNYYDAFLADIPWMAALNSGREPFFYSIYVGPLLLLVGAAALAARPRANAPWAVLAIVFVVAAMGGYTPLYPLARRLVPALGYFRFPVKYVIVTAFSAAVVAADGCEILVDPRYRRVIGRAAVVAGALAAAVAVLVTAAALATPTSLRLAAALAARVHVEHPSDGATYLVRVAPALVARSAGLLLAGSALLVLAVRGGPRSRVAAGLFLVAALADLVATNADLNPTSPVGKMSPPAWYAALRSEPRLYVGGRGRGYMNAKDPDGTDQWEVPAENSAVEGRLELNAELPMAPSGWDVREAISYDLPALWPAEYDALLGTFERAGAAERLAFLRRAGVRWCVWPATRGGARVVAEVPHWRMAVYDCNPGATRAFVTTMAEVGADPAWQRAALFDAALPDTILRLDAVPPTAGAPRTAARSSIGVLEDGTNHVVLSASLPRDGYVVLRDTYDPWWRATIDGAPASIARANGIYRAVHVTAGDHVIRFEYRPRDVFAGLIVSVSSGLVMIAMLVTGLGRSKRSGAGRDADASVPRPGGSGISMSRRAGEAGFTLIELMIVIAVIAILLSVAFAQYRRTRTAADEAVVVATLRTIGRAQAQFALTCGNQKFSSSLAGLGQPVPTTGVAFLSPDLTSGDLVEKAGYQLNFVAKPIQDAPPACNGATVAEGYAVTADPLGPELTGRVFFAINADRVVYEDEAQTFTGNMPESGAPGHGSEVK